MHVVILFAMGWALFLYAVCASLSSWHELMNRETLQWTESTRRTEEQSITSLDEAA